jgi:zinc protease
MLVRPAPGPPRAYRFPVFSRSRLANGVEVIVAPFHRLPLATVRVVVEAGAVSDVPGAEGAAWLTAKCLAEGTQRRSSEELTLAVERLGGELDPEADWNDVSLSSTIRSSAVGEALDLMSELICAPRFPEEGVARNRNEQSAERDQARRDPRQHADDMFTRAAYARGARFALSEAGERETIGGFDRSVVERFHREHFAPERTCVIVVGAVTEDEVIRRLDTALGSWQGPGASRGDARAVDQPAPREAILVVDRPGAPQSELRLGHVGLPRLHPDYFATVVMNSILGGLFNSRINMNLRERHGYTYGAFSAFHWRVQAGPFMISTAVQSDATGASVGEILGEIDRIRGAPISEEELRLAVNFLAGVFPIRYETSAAISGALAAMRVFGLPADYFNTYRDRIRSVSREDVLAAAQRHVRPEDLHIVALGDALTIEPQLASLGRDVRRAVEA